MFKRFLGSVLLTSFLLFGSVVHAESSTPSNTDCLIVGVNVNTVFTNDPFLMGYTIMYTPIGSQIHTKLSNHYHVNACVQKGKNRIFATTVFIAGHTYGPGLTKCNPINISAQTKQLSFVVTVTADKTAPEKSQVTCVASSSN